jgi:hypothetical protein
MARRFSRPLATGVVGLVCLALLFNSASGEEKYAQIGLGTTFEGDSIAYAFDLVFNRTEAQESEAGPYLRVWSVGNRSVLALQPSATASLGNGTESSPNNLTLKCQLRLQHQQLRATNWIFALAPTATSDKDFTTELAYGRLKVEWLYFTSGKRRFYVLAGAGGDVGSRKSKGTSWDGLARIVPSLEAKMVIGEKLSLGILASIYAIWGDKTVIPNGTYGNTIATADYRFYVPKGKGPSAGLSAKYIVGRDEPGFKKMNALTAGVSLYR